MEAGSKLFPRVGCKLLWDITEGLVAVAIFLFTFFFFCEILGGKRHPPALSAGADIFMHLCEVEYIQPICLVES